jgi:hypothetical protein
MSLFKDSIAQSNVAYPIETVIIPMAGENYSRAMIYMDVANAATYLPGVTSATAGSLIELDSGNYGELTGGLLKKWLVPFFSKATTAKVGIALFNTSDTTTPSTHPLAAVYEATKMYAYFKFIIEESAGYAAAQVALSNLCITDPLYSVLWVGTNDGDLLTKSSALLSALKSANSTARVIYNADGNINPALAQLGATLSSANATGTPVGNSMDMVQFNTIDASGAENADGERLNLSATEKAALDEQKVGYQTWVGDGTENVVTEGSLYINGDSVGANWVKAYIEYMCKVKTANYITRMNTFRNNQTYQACLLILSDMVNPFLQFGRLAGFQITAPVFEDLPASGDQITVPNAWEATYIDNVREVTVYGTLYLTQPTR